MSNVRNLNEEQKDAVQNQSQYILVLAGPGSGKTTVLLERLKYQIETCHKDSSQFLLITFTKAAAVSMEQRFHQLTNSQYPNLVFCTFHALFYQILKRAHLVDEHSFMTHKEQEEILQAIIRRENIKETYPQILSQLQQIDRLELSQEQVESLQKIKQLYQKEKNKRNKIEYDDMADLCLKLFGKHPEQLSYWKERFSTIYVDEFQDINESQYILIKKLAKEKNQLMVVGDDDQSIYGFRGSNPRIIQEFLVDFPQVHHITLGENYRSSKTLVSISRGIIEENKTRLNKNLIGMNQDAASPFQLHCVIDEKEQFDKMADCIKAYSKAKQVEIAIIARTNYQLKRIKKELNNRRLGATIFAKKAPLMEQDIFKDLHQLISIIYEKKEEEPIERKIWLRIIQALQLNIPRESLEQPMISKQTFFEYPNKELAQLKEDFLRIQKMPISLGITYIRKKLKYDLYVKKKAYDEKEEEATFFRHLNLIQEYSKRYGTVVDFLLHYEAEFNIVENNECITDIKLLTMHMSKGLEFERVFILDCNYGMIPPGKNLKEDELEEERRLFYVAVTRAKKTLDLFYLSGTKENPRLPSIFLKTILS